MATDLKLKRKAIHRALYQAIKNNNKEIVVYLMICDKTPIYRGCNYQKDLPELIYEAATQSSQKVFEMTYNTAIVVPDPLALLEYVTDNIDDDITDTELSRYLDICYFLLEKISGPNIKLYIPMCQHLLKLSCRIGHLEMIVHIIKLGIDYKFEGGILLEIAVKANQTKLTKHLIVVMKLMNVAQPRFVTILESASKNNNFELVTVCMKYYPD